MEKFKLEPNTEQPEWFREYLNQRPRPNAIFRVVADPPGQQVAYLWTPSGIQIATQGDTIINRYEYCSVDKP